MNRLAARTLILSMLFASNDAFSPVRSSQRQSIALFDTTSTPTVEAPTEEASVPDVDSSTAPALEKKKKVNKNAEGIFAPAVLLTKDIVGETELNKLRAKIIGLHSDVIGKFTETAQSEFGNQVLKVLFTLADKNGDGTIDEEELAEALQSLGFDFLKEKQIAGIFARADADKNGQLDFEEWQKAAPKTLKTSLIKLAKKNGHDLGFLA
ncbi:unnamed protein product [Pseudo-nitzschia multistriata]|uniref:EF-hand domain-containing protein n=1 Tax=Pseudo-nitzschia multistriata TaxID=183589 RepID=A0A448ZB54_9STRA|nr:unnamed protein product [Pseudo-nitzschia multistriata]